MLATHVVTSLANAGEGSLRDVMAGATSGDTIDARELTGTITLTTHIFSGSNETGITILGPGRDRLTIDASASTQGAFRLNNAGIELRDVKVIGSSAARSAGGAIHLTGGGSSNADHYLRLTRVEIADSFAYEIGGGVYLNAARLTVTDSLFSDNTATTLHTSGSASFAAMGGAIYAIGSDVRIEGSTFDGNHALGDATLSQPYAFSYGGGLYVQNGVTDISRSTFTNNRATASQISPESEGEAFAMGGAIATTQHLEIRNSTIVGNTAKGNLGANVSEARFIHAVGGIYNTAGTTGAVTLHNTIVAANVVQLNDAAAPFHPDVFLSSSDNDVQGSLIGAVTQSLNMSPGSTNNLTGTRNDPLNVAIAPLADNGGPTPTMAPTSASPAIRTDALSDTPRIDQRGFVAIDAADIGAYEVNAFDPDTVVGPAEFTSSPKLFLDSTATAGYMRGIADVANGTANYQWTLVAKPENAADPILANPTARSTDVQFFKTGTYVYRLTADNGEGDSASKRLTFTIETVARNLHIVQHGEAFSATKQTRLKARIYDQFGGRVSPAPETKWSLLEGDGRLTSTGLFTPAEGTTFSRLRIRARALGLEGTTVNYVRTA